MHTSQTQKLIRRYLAGKCTEEEKDLVETSYMSYQAGAPALSEAEVAADIEIIYSGLPAAQKPVKYLHLRRTAAVAAILFLFISITVYELYHLEKINGATSIQHSQQIRPGKDRAILTLANGEKILLDTNASTILTYAKSGVRVTKTSEGTLRYQVAAMPGNNSRATGYNTIQTPKGSQYQVILPDGTHVWLNAESSLRYPVVFTGKSRAVELSGEGYFEVAKNPDMPFSVQSADQQVTVLGTHFNISAYPQGGPVKTTLLEGKVKVTRGTSHLIMLPNQQVTQTGIGLQLANVPDAREVIAWKNGLFLFNHEELHSIMAKISRWYDVEVEYQDELRGQFYSGTITKYGNIHDVLRIMELTKSVHFKIQGRRIIVMK